MNQKNRQRIGLVLPNIPAYSETFFNSKIKGLQDNGFEVVLFSKSKSRKKHPKCKTVFSPNFTIRPFLVVEILLIFINCLFYFKSARILFQLNKKEGLSDINSIKNICINSYFFSHKLTWLHFGFGTMALQSEHVAEAINAKMAVSFRGFDFYVYPTKHHDCYALLFSKKVRYHVLSEKMKTTLIKIGISSSAIFKISPAIDLTLFEVSEEKMINNVKQFLTISRLHWIKDIEHTLEAFSIFKNNKIPFHYTIIGEGVELESLIFAVHQLGLQENVTFKGKIQHQEVKAILKENEYYIQYSKQEGFGNAVLEAQAMGLLCIVSDADGLIENVIDQKTGWVVPKRNPKLLADKMIEVVQLDKTILSEIKINAMKRVREEFNIGNQSKLFTLFYKN
jgi:glycosyltransferase involved in cell wall biosynthesis